MSLESLASDHAPNSTEVFLDTSIHCSKLKGPLFTERIDRVLAMFGFIGTSSYTKVEFGNVVLARADYYLRTLKKLGSIDKTLGHIGNVLPAKVHHHNITWSFNLLSQTLGQTDAERTERAKLSLTRLLKYGTRQIERDCHVSDGTECYWARKTLERDRSGIPRWKTPNCKRSKKLCKLDEFFDRNKPLFQQIKNDIDGMPDNESKTPQLRGFSEVIGKALTDPGSLLDYKTGCKRLADAIIAVESEKYGSMFTQNVTDSSVLCKTLQQTLYYLPPSEEKGVLIQSPDSN